PAPAQQVLVQNGATVQVQNGATFDLQGGQMDFGLAGATARLEETSAGRVAGGTLTATRALDGPSSADPAGLGAVLSASENLGEVTVVRGHTVQTGSGNESIRRYYNLSATGTNSGLSATLTHTYHDAELNNLSESGLELFKSTDGGSTWSQEGADSRTTSPTGGNTVTLNGVESFSRWTLGSSSSPLPVELASFEASRTDAGGAAGSEEAVRLKWQTASESGNAGFRVERARARGRGSESAWTEVGFVEGGGTTSEAQSYRFTDTDLPYAADTLSYRLRQVDTDGSAQVTDPVTVARGGVSSLELKETYPNPARTRVTVRFAVPDDAGAEGDVRLRLYDVLGRQVQAVRTGAEGGRHETQLSVSDLASGVYVLRLQAGGNAQTRRLTVVK
ncbi:MAG: T9SS type A sorting domain-containing protein, partial [Salinivenus sp.]